MEDFDSRIPNNLKKYRGMSEYSQKEVAAILGFKSTSRMSRWEKGLSMPSVENLLKLSFLYSTLQAELYADLWKSVKDELHDKKLKIDT
jgi:transcriptional regulator with XRE-family HTH domain